METRTHKRGDTFLLAGTRADKSGNPVVITGMTITSKVRRVAYQQALVVTITDPANGAFSLSQADTSTWPIGTLFCDVQFISGSTTVSSETFKIVVEEDVTF